MILIIVRLNQRYKISITCTVNPFVLKLTFPLGLFVVLEFF